MRIPRSFKGAVGAIKKQVRHGYVRVLRSPGAPREIAGGLAVGLFVAFLPILQMPVAVAIASVIGGLTSLKLSRVAAAAGVWLTNPLTGGPLYGSAFLIGRPVTKALFGVAPESLPKIELAHLSSLGPVALQALLALLIGGVIVGIPVAVAGYHLSHAMVVRYQQRRARRALGLGARAALAPVPVAVSDG